MEDYPDNSDNVLAFTKQFDSNADIKEKRNFVEERRASRLCSHPSILVSEHSRTVTCRICGAVLDAFDHLLSLAKKETEIDWELTALRLEIKSHREGLGKLKREEANCKARIRTAKKQLI